MMAEILNCIEILYNKIMKMNEQIILEALSLVAEGLDVEHVIEITLIGGAAGMLTREFDENRVTRDCDMISIIPEESLADVEAVAKNVASKFNLSPNWLNAQAMQLDVLPDGWDIRKVLIEKYSNFHVYSLSRQDLIATKFYAGSTRDREDIIKMSPTADELYFVKNYLSLLKVPSRETNLDQIEKAFYYLKTFDEE